MGRIQGVGEGSSALHRTDAGARSKRDSTVGGERAGDKDWTGQDRTGQVRSEQDGTGFR